ncbi:MAG: hypothetical protein FWG10_03770 [Eubacteriaceae bacterium]|nr:hypothetical protein [Eubacteriaceae bacterium]
MDFEYISSRIAIEVNQSFFGMLPREITNHDVDFSNAYKIYTGTNIFALGTNNFDDLKKNLEKGGYFYEFLIYVDGHTVIVDISRVLPATKKEYRMMQDPEGYATKVGNWEVSGVGYSSPEFPFADYYASAYNASGIRDRTPLLVRDLPCFFNPVALYPGDNGEIGKFVIISYPSKPDYEKWEELGWMKGMAFDYAKIKSIINALPTVSFPTRGNLTVLIAVAFILGGFVYGKLQRQQQG